MVSAAVAVRGSKLRQIRQQAGIELADLAAAAEISKPRLSQLETGRHPRVRVRTFRLICERLGIPREDRWQLMADGDDGQERDGEPAQAVA